ncbi:MAG: aminopeptidase [Thermomicrobiales bacterium]
MRQLALARGARTLVETCAAVKPGERLLIVTDLGRPFSVAEALALAGTHAGAMVTTIIMPPVATGQEPPDPVRGAMLAADVVLAPVSGSLFHTTAARLAVEAGARLISVTEATEALLIDGGCLADFDAAAVVAARLRIMLSEASELRVSAPGGTDLVVSLAGREGMAVTGLAREPGIRTAWPDIEAFIAPVEGTGQGIVVVDASASNLGLIREPIRMHVSEGRVVTITGGRQGREVERALAATNHEGSYVIAEVGIGLNPTARLRGSIVEDEGVYGTAHVALGNNTNFAGGVNAAPIHFDYVFLEPTIALDGRTIMRDGVLVDSG